LVRSQYDPPMSVFLAITVMDVDTDLVDRAVLALLYINYLESGACWKQVPWSATDRIYAQGLISDPVNKNKSVHFTDEGLEQAERAYKELFTK